MFEKLVSAITGGDGGDLLLKFLAKRATSDSNKEALIGTLLGQGLGTDNPLKNMFGAETDEKPEQMSVLQQGINTGASGPDEAIQQVRAMQAANAANKGIAAVNPISRFKQADGTLGYADFLINAGVLQPDSKIASLLNSRVGEALATSLVAGLGSKMGSSDGGSNYAPRPFGGTGNTSINIPGARPNVMGAAQGGYIDGQYFPRRNGGIMPSEGSGQKDDVPAMLMAGEFVLTKDAVKGLGNGNSQQGIQKAYSLMNQLEEKVA